MIYQHKHFFLSILCNADYLIKISFSPLGIRGVPTSPLEREICEQLDQYFSGRRKQFDLPLQLQGSPFQLAVWKTLQEIPYGETRSYAQIAFAIGKPGACRAVGAANHNNPIPLIIPCHRVIGSNGKLTGYAGGLELKQFLLDLEHRA